MASTAVAKPTRRDPEAGQPQRVQDFPEVAQLYRERDALQARRGAVEREYATLSDRQSERGSRNEVSERAAAALAGNAYEPEMAPDRRQHELRMESQGLLQAIETKEKEIRLASLDYGGRLYESLERGPVEAGACKVLRTLRELVTAIRADATNRQRAIGRGIPMGCLCPVDVSFGLPDVYRQCLPGGPVEFFLESAARYLPKE